MITTKEKIVNQLLGTIYNDLKDKTVLHVNMDNVLSILIANDLIIPKKQFEMHAEALLTKKLVGVPLGHITKYAMAELLYTLALELALSKEELIKYTIKHQNDDTLNMTDKSPGK